MTTPRLGAPELALNQAVPETTVNETFYWLDAGSGGGFLFLDRDLTAPPGSPAQGDTYLVDTGATGAWSGHDDEIAVYINTAWEFIPPSEGFLARVSDENIWIGYDGSVWGTLSVGGALPTEASAAEIRTGTATGKYVSPDKMFDAADGVALTPGTNVSVDLSTGFNFTLAMGGNYTLDNPTNLKAGQTGVIEITQDGTGTRTLAYGTAWKFAGGTDPVLSTAASTKDLLFYQVLANETDVYANLVKAIA
jgi:hypothetical protein